MRSILRSAARAGLAAAAAWLAAGAPAPAAAEPVGFIASLHGEVRLERGGTWQAAARDVEVEVGDGVRTGPEAGARILLVDDTLLQVGEDTAFRIESWHVGDAATREPSIVRQSRGRLRTIVGEAFGGSTRVEVHLPTAAVGVKGTDFETADESTGAGERWSACLHSGGIVVSNAFGSAEPAPGWCVYTYPDRGPGDPYRNPRPPLDADGGPREVAEEDFTEPVGVDVAADGEGPGLPPPTELPGDEDELIQNEGGFPGNQQIEIDDDDAYSP